MSTNTLIPIQPATGSNIDDIADKLYSGERISPADGLRLLEHNNIVEIAALADYVRWKKNPDPVKDRGSI